MKTIEKDMELVIPKGMDRDGAIEDSQKAKLRKLMTMSFSALLFLMAFCQGAFAYHFAMFGNISDLIDDTVSITPGLLSLAMVSLFLFIVYKFRDSLGTFFERALGGKK